jgi:hypothetical protein
MASKPSELIGRSTKETDPDDYAETPGNGYATAVYVCSPETERGKPVKLFGDTSGKNFMYARGKHLVVRDIEVSNMLAIHPSFLSKLDRLPAYA